MSDPLRREKDPNRDTNKEDKPLRLYEVLEEEYERLHGVASPSLDINNSAEERLKQIVNENHNQQLAAVCLSGGGIRSATFGLGVLQGLAHNKLLSKFSYISTVSGGGYVGSWLSAWIRRHPDGLTGVESRLPSENPPLLLKPEPEPIEHLRNYSNYLTPKLGLLSADTWTLVAIVIRNLLLNWLVLIPLMVGALALPRLFLSYAQWSAPDVIRVAALVVGFVCGVAMIVYIAISRPSITNKHRDQKHFLVCCLLPLLVSATALALYWAWVSNAGNHALESRLTLGLVDALSRPFRYLLFGILLHLVAWVISTIVLISRRVKARAFAEFLALLFNGAVGGALVWLVTQKVFPHPTIEIWSTVEKLEVRELLLYSSFAVPIYLVLIFLGLTLFTGVSSRFTEDEDREWWARASAWILISIVVWGAASFLVLVGPPLTSYLVAKFILPAGGLVGIVTALAARSANVPAKDQKDAKGITGILMSYALPLGSIIFLAVLIVALSIGTNYLLELLAITLRWLLPKLSLSVEWMHNQQVDPGRSVATDIDVIIFPAAREIYFLILLTAFIGWLAAKYINTNKFSHHAMYRNRIIRAYLGASRRTRDRHPDPFTGFDPADNLSMCDLRPQLLHSGSFQDAQQQSTFANFVKRLKAKTDPASQTLVDEVLTKTTVKLLDRAETDHSLVLLENAVIKDLNQAMLKQVEILPPRTNTEKSQEAWVNYNRQLLQDAFNDFIRPVPAPPRGPLHVVNMTLNLVHGNRLAWQQRKAESFTVTPLHSGSFQIPDTGERGTPVYGSYRRSHEYAGSGGITIGTAVAISGAAVSPNMGYYSSPIVGLLMTLFNVRLGWWLGNPGPAGAKHYRLAYPKSALYPIVAEALGLTDDHNSYIYLTDGGHFENLGLYEMVLRRCRLIVVSDASDDANFQFDNLGNAVKKIRVDFGIPIDFKSMQIFPRSEKKKGAFCAIGTIRYSCVDKIDKVDDKGQPCEVAAPDGLIVYIKPVFYGDEPRDVYHYAMTHETFPHESTVDQWFSETQFESYRKLGSYVVDTICKYPTDGGPDEGLNEPALKTFYDQAQQSSNLDEPDGARSQAIMPE
jgi:Patatin-like phospholipase